MKHILFDLFRQGYFSRFNPADILTTDTSHDRKTILGNAVLRPFFFEFVYPVGIIQIKSLLSKKECDSYRFCHTPLNV